MIIARQNVGYIQTAQAVMPAGHAQGDVLTAEPVKPVMKTVTTAQTVHLAPPAVPVRMITRGVRIAVILPIHHVQIPARLIIIAA
jgi:hypothetical protein